MERRKILLGSGAAITTALAGCTGNSTDDDDDESGNDTVPITDNETESDDSNETDDGASNETDGNGQTDGSNGSDGTDEGIPGFDSTKLELESDAVSITSIERAGETVEVVATSETPDYEKLYGELETLAADHAEAVVDADAFTDEIETVEWVVDHDGKRVVSFTVETAWLVSYLEGKLSKEEVLEKVKATAE